MEATNEKQMTASDKKNTDKREWQAPCLKSLEVSATAGEPGAPEGDGEFPNTANPKIS